MENVILAPRRATVLFDSVVTDASIATLVDKLHAVIRELYYKEVELKIFSPGGSTSSLTYFVTALEALKARDGVTINTSALTAVSSASAIMLSMGDRRRAGAASQLLYHGARLSEQKDITAADAQRSHAALANLDAYFIDLLVQRAFLIDDWQDRWPPSVNASNDSDAAAFGVPTRDRWLTVLGARKQSDEAAEAAKAFLADVYAAVFRANRFIPPELARTIGLIDAVDPLGFGDLPDVPARTEDFPVVVPEWATLLPPHGQFPLDNLKRHILVFGETGSGKTASGILPLLRAIVKSSVLEDRRRVSCALVVDPKRELAAAIQAMGHSPTLIGKPPTGRPGSSAGYVFNLMEHTPPPVDLAGHAKAILARLGGLTYSPASTLLEKTYGETDPYWAAEGVEMAAVALGIALLICDGYGRPLDVDVNAGNDEDATETSEAKEPARDPAADGVRRTLHMCAAAAGISALTATAAETIKERSLWLEELTKLYRESALKLRSHGFVIDRLRDRGALVHEIRGWSFKAYDLDVHLEWRILDVGEVASAPWRAVQSPVESLRLGDEFERMKDTLRDCGPPLATMGTQGESEDFQFTSLDRSRVASVSVPVLHRDPEVANDRERLLVIMDVKAELEPTSADRLGELAHMETELLEGLRGLRERYDPDREASPDASSWVLMTALCGAEFSPGSFVGARFGDDEEYDDGVYAWQFEELPPAETLAEYGADDCGDSWPSDASTALQWYEMETGRSASIATTCAIRHAKKLRAMVEAFGIRLCGILCRDQEKGKEVWEARIQEQVRRRAKLVTTVIEACQELRERASAEQVLLPRDILLGANYRALFGSRETIADGMERGERAYRTHLEAYENEAAHRHMHEEGRVSSGVSVVGLADLIMKEGLRVEVVKAWPRWLKQVKAAIVESEAKERGFDEFERRVQYFGDLANTPGQYTGALGAARKCFSGFSDEGIARTLYFGCEPFWYSVTKWERGRVMRFSDYLNDKDQSIFVVQPDLGKGADLIGKTLKALFFESVLRDKEREQAGHTLPLVAYVADEFHRFITADRTHGEQSFLDTCRSFGVCCVLACQSTASMEHALLGLQTGESEVQSAISIIFNNTGTKLFFRTTDVRTKAMLREIAPMPGRAGMRSVVDVRPPATLAIGECYAVVVDGRFVRVKLDWWPGDDPAR